MPLNEILAPAYLKVSYDTGIYVHQIRAYLDGLWTLPDPGEPTLFELDHTVGGGSTPALEIVTEIFTRAHAFLPTDTIVTGCELWHSVSGSNVFVGFNDFPDSDEIGTSDVTGIAAATIVMMFSGAARQPFRMTFADTGDAKPQRFAGSTPPDVDNDSLPWYMLKSGVPFVTNDNIKLSLWRSTSTGYNRKLARLYGRNIIP